MAKRWTEAELRFLKDNAGKMSIQAIAEVLSVRIDELEKRMDKLGLTGALDAPVTGTREPEERTRSGAVPCTRGLTMDDNGTTYLCDLMERDESEPAIDTTLPMYLIVVNGGIPGAMLRVAPEGTRVGA